MKLVIDCTVDGNPLGKYEFDCTYVASPTKLQHGPITIHFDPVSDFHHQMEITTLPAGQSKTIKGIDPETAST